MVSACTIAVAFLVATIGVVLVSFERLIKPYAMVIAALIGQPLPHYVESVSGVRDALSFAIFEFPIIAAQYLHQTVIAPFWGSHITMP
jgi:hypothetical protein